MTKPCACDSGARPARLLAAPVGARAPPPPRQGASMEGSRRHAGHGGQPNIHVRCCRVCAVRERERTRSRAGVRFRVERTSACPRAFRRAGPRGRGVSTPSGPPPPLPSSSADSSALTRTAAPFLSLSLSLTHSLSLSLSDSLTHYLSIYLSICLSISFSLSLWRRPARAATRAGIAAVGDAGGGYAGGGSAGGGGGRPILPEHRVMMLR